MLWNDLLVERHKHTHTYEAINLMQNADLTEKSGTFIKHKNLLSHIKMGKEILTFGNIETEENKFYHNKTLLF